jgi:K+-sensing histidine kinase KdpD
MWTFQAALSHKLLTPLNQMLAPLTMLANGTDDLSSEDAAFFATSALAGAQRLHNEIGKVLHYVQTPALAPTMLGFPLSQLCATVTRLCKDLDLQTVHTAIPPELDEGLLTLSESAMEILLHELLENARKFHPTHTPTVTVQLRRMDSQHVCLRVVDDGLTLSPAHLAQVWTPYYQGEKQFTGEVTGMGLGLPLVASLVWNVGGRCCLSNRPDGPGVAVEVLLPLAQDEWER